MQPITSVGSVSCSGTSEVIPGLQFQRGQVVGASLPDTSVSKVIILFGIFRGAVSKVMCSYCASGKNSI